MLHALAFVILFAFSFLAQKYALPRIGLDALQFGEYCVFALFYTPYVIYSAIASIAESK